MTPTITSRFDTTNKILRVTDTFNYSTLPYLEAFGNVTASIGNTVFHTNLQFDSNADIVIGTNTFKDIDLPLDSLQNIQTGSYKVKYDVKISYASAVTPPEAATFGFIFITPDNQALIDEIEFILANYPNPSISFLNGSGDVLGTSIITNTGSDYVIDFNVVTIPSFGDITDILISNIYTTERVYSFDNCNIVQKVDLNAIVDCFRAQITLQDVTEYPSFVSSLTREMVLRYPRRANGNEVAPAVETSNPSLTVGPNIWSGGYLFSLKSTMTWQQSDGLNILQVLQTQLDKDVICDAGLCNAAKCINSLRVKYQEALKVGDRNINNLQIQNFNVLLYVNSYNVYLSCRDTENASKVLNELLQYLDVVTDGECGCGCSPSSQEPTIIYPLFSNN